MGCITASSPKSGPPKGSVTLFDFGPLGNCPVAGYSRSGREDWYSGNVWESPQRRMYFWAGLGYGI